MIGLDTNVLVRYLVQDDPNQAAKATHLIEDAAARGEPCFLSCVVLCETAWVLASAYDCDRKAIGSVLEKILSVKSFEIESRDAVLKAVNSCLKDRGDFPDLLIGALCEANSCATTITFDKKLGRVPGFQVL